MRYILRNIITTMAFKHNYTYDSIFYYYFPVFKIPVYVGANDGLVEKYKHIGTPFHGEDGFGNIIFDKHPNLSKIRTDEPACIAMLRIVKQFPGTGHQLLGLRSSLVYLLKPNYNC